MTTYHPNDRVRLKVPTGSPDHNGQFRTWSVKVVFRVLLESPDGTVTVSDDSRGLRTRFEVGQLACVTRAEHCTPHTESER